MPRKLITLYCLLLTALSSCTPTPSFLIPSLVLYRFDPPAFLEYNEDLELIKEIPFSIPPTCGLYSTFPAPIGQFLLIELNCPNGQTVLFLNLETASVSQPVTDTDAHFLAWTSDGQSVYLKIDSLGSPKIVRVTTNGKQQTLPIPEFTYDLSVNPVNDDFTFTLSRGLGMGSELHSTQYAVRNTKLLYTDPHNYISFARFSPDGERIAFIKTPDTQTPFAVGELWMTDSNGTNAQKLADVDSGHGYAANWSPDGTKIAFVARENPDDENANRSSEALVSNIYVIDILSGNLTQVTSLTEGYAETPYWSPLGNTLAFNTVINGRMTVFIADMSSDKIRPFEADSVCCPAWMRK